MAALTLDNKVVVLGAMRTPIGAIGGSLSSFKVWELGIMVLKKLLAQSGIDPAVIQYTTTGWVMQDSRSPNLAKIISELSGIPHTAPGTTLHENCASGGAAIHDIVRRLLVGDIEIGVAIGVESMSNIPRCLYEGRIKGQTYGDYVLVDGVMDALKDRFVGKEGELMGFMTERLVEKYKVTRAEQDEIAFNSHHNALKTWNDGLFADYVMTVEIPQRKGNPVLFAKDEGPRPITMEQLTSQKPYFKKDGTVTGMNSSSINDAAAALILATPQKAKELGKKPLASLYGYHSVGVPRELMGEGAFKVIPGLLKKTGLTLADIDFFELNEAFAAVVGGAFHDIPELEPGKVNQWGSGIALGHPVGCTGARQVVDMVHQLQRRHKKIGLTTRCVGGGIGSGELIVSMEL